MQRILANSAVLLSLGVFAIDTHSTAGQRLAYSEDWGLRGCIDSMGEQLPHGTTILGADHCQEHVCQDGIWEAGSNRCGKELGLPSPGPAGHPAASGSEVTRFQNPTESLDCPIGTLKDGKWVCPNQNLTLAERRTLFDSMKPFDEINGVKLDDYWPATAGLTVPIAENYEYDYEGVSFKGYRLTRPTGERAPIHYHEVAQLLCLEKGKIMVVTEGEEPKMYKAPDCYMMPAYTKVSVISIEGKTESCLLRVPHGGLDWVVIEPKYYDLQGQWTEDLTSDKKH